MATGSGPSADPFVEDEAFANLVARFASDAPPPTARLLQWDDAAHAAMPAPA
jgi:hypothetical protein